jgi:hydrogenase maturation protein HypF
MLRRSRGYVPDGLDLPVETASHLLGCGAELKNTFCLAKGRRAWVGHHIGDLQNFETLTSFRQGVEHFERLFAVDPQVYAHDLHPDYLSTRYAQETDGGELVGVQHHHAHLAACLAEHGESGSALGAIYDGTGYGSDGSVWGGELLHGSLAEFERVGHLRPLPMPGGEAAIREPWRMACAWLTEALQEEPERPAALAGAVDAAAWSDVHRLARAGLASPLTSSMGRLFDAVAALCGIRPRVNYEGQAAVELEAAAAADERGTYPLDHLGTPQGLLLDARETVLAVAGEMARGVEVALIAARFHNAVARATATACAKLAGASTETVVLSGGVFQNRLLLERTAALLEAGGLRVLVPERLPPNDGGISYGQVAVAAARAARA